MRRRDFLHLGATAAAWAQARPLFGAAPKQSGPVGANNRIRTAIIGCGNRGRAVMREWIEHADTTFVAACDVDQARTIVVIKRSLAPGYAGIKNPLFELENCMMVFLDAKEALEGIVKEVKNLG